MKRKLLATLGLLAIVAVAGCSGKKTEANANDKQSPDMTAGTAASTSTTQPDISFEAYDTKGVMHASSEWIGKQPTVVNMWGTWCPPCRREIPDLVKLYAEYHPKGVEVIGLAVNDAPDKAEQFAQANDMNWVMLMGTRDIARAFQTASVPLTVFYDKSGKEVARLSGAQTYDSFKSAFDKIAQN